MKNVKYFIIGLMFSMFFVSNAGAQGYVPAHPSNPGARPPASAPSHQPGYGRPIQQPHPVYGGGYRGYRGGYNNYPYYAGAFALGLGFGAWAGYPYWNSPPIIYQQSAPVYVTPPQTIYVEPAAPQSSVAARLAEVDRLMLNGTISFNEAQELRAKILRGE